MESCRKVLAALSQSSGSACARKPQPGTGDFFSNCFSFFSIPKHKVEEDCECCHKAIKKCRCIYLYVANVKLINLRLLVIKTNFGLQLQTLWSVMNK